MNERILHLAASHFPRDGEGNISATPEMIMEFAEVIVKECADFIDSKLEMTEYSHEVVAWADGADLKEHFGVES